VHRLRLLFLCLSVRRAAISAHRQFRLTGGPEPDNSPVQYEKYGANRLSEGKLPLCAEMCSTKSLLAGDSDIIAEIYKDRVAKRGYGSGAWGWQTAYRESIST
jgi:formate dehydrogenase iron-sulfur subunit